MEYKRQQKVYIVSRIHGDHKCYEPYEDVWTVSMLPKNTTFNMYLLRSETGAVIYCDECSMIPYVPILTEVELRQGYQV